MTKKTKINIILTILFGWCLTGAILVVPPAILPVIAIYIFLLLFPKNKKDVETAGETVRNGIEYIGTWGKEISKTGVTIGVVTGILIKETVEEFYKRIGGDEGAKKAIKALGKLAETGLKICVEATIVAGKVVASVTKHTMKRIEQERNSEKKLLDDSVEWRIINDDEEANYKNFVNTDDD